jgi:hypothetical protein
MQRGAKLDAPGTLHHVIARGIERRQIKVSDRPFLFKCQVKSVL